MDRMLEPDMAYYKFTEAIERNEEISVFNKGKMKRDFTYIDDIIDGLTKIVSKVPKNNIMRLPMQKLCSKFIISETISPLH